MARSVKDVWFGSGDVALIWKENKFCLICKTCHKFLWRRACELLIFLDAKYDSIWPFFCWYFSILAALVCGPSLSRFRVMFVLFSDVSFQNSGWSTCVNRLSLFPPQLILKLLKYSPTRRHVFVLNSLKSYQNVAEEGALPSSCGGLSGVQTQKRVTFESFTRAASFGSELKDAALTVLTSTESTNHRLLLREASARSV